MDTNERMHELGKMLYGAQWPLVARHNAERISGGQTIDIDALTEAQQKSLVDGMNKLNAKRTVALKKAGA